MVKKLIKHGNSAALILDKALLEILQVNMDTSLEITTDGQNIIISPATSEKNESDLLSALERVNKAHSKTLARLAE